MPTIVGTHSNNNVSLDHSFVSVSCAAKRWGVSPDLLYRDIARGDLMAYRHPSPHGGKNALLRVYMADVDALFEPANPMAGDAR
ncbi:hypothetical protein OZX73_06040 [Bifidobacterium sp. ESL0775]|uniref:hypothetical protein n=1 Tax=Bifidobacterium sp. ESL0775 TaxID=2983230 RepID=UPI0023F6B720|nr:hypothetical protein [Bifidobacterium sp. ESL0775]WEV68847.1 hypothetical protein OZX73_06040 [Bifidobacterium sp. ESL0775]